MPAPKGHPNYNITCYGTCITLIEEVIANEPYPPDSAEAISLEMLGRVLKEMYEEK